MQLLGLLSISVSLFCLAALIAWPAPRAYAWLTIFRRNDPRPARRSGFDVGAALQAFPLTQGLKPRQFTLLRWVSGVLAACLYALPSWLQGRAVVLPATIVGIAGYSLPALLLRHAIHRRRVALDRALMDLVSHLGLMLAAGCHPLEAFERAPQVVREPLRSELRQLIPDLRLSTLPAALERFAARTDSAAIAAFVRQVMAQQSLGIQLHEVLELQEQVHLRRQEERADRRIEAATAFLALGSGMLLANTVAIAAVPFWYYITGAFGM